MSTSDTKAPELTGLTYTPTKIDTSSGPQTVTVRVDLRDTPAGVYSAEVRFKSPSGGQIAGTYLDAAQLIAGDAYKGRYENTITFPQHSEQGIWTIDFVFLRDQVGNYAWLQAADVQNLGSPFEIDQKGAGDTTPPNLDSLGFSPAQGNAAAGPVQVTVKVELTDKEAGVTSAEVRFKSPTAGQIANAYFTASELISGDVYNGVYETTLTIPRYAEQGTWTVEFAYLRDQVNNNVWLQTADLQNLGFPTTFSQLGVGDRCAPYLESLSFTPNQVAASAASQTVMVAARLSDRPAGVASGEVRFKSPTGGQIAGVYFGPAERISGDAYSGDYQAAMTIPQLAEQGTWLIEFAYLRDQAGSSIWLSTADLQGSGFPAALTVT